jgi:Domain of unknown function (DUF4265)
MSGPTEHLVKIRFPLDPADWKDLKSESLWAREIAPGRYRVKNSPFYVYGISAEDVVYARDQEGVLTFVSVYKRAGHSTYRILLKPEESVKSARFLQNWMPLEDIGCAYELAKSRWLAVDVPPQADIFVAYQLLEKGEAAKVWTFEEAHCGHPVEKTRLL